MSVRRSVLLVLGLLAVLLAPIGGSPAYAAGTVTVSVQGQGSVTGDGINCTQTGGPDCSEFYADTTYQECDPLLKPPCHTITETAVAAFTAGADTNGYVFDGWTGCGATDGRTCTQTVDGDTSVTARFRDAQAPAVSAPSPGSGFQHSTISLSATATDNAAIQRVEFLVGGVVVGSDTSAPYQFAWNSASVADGVKSLTARAVDTSNNVSTSSASSITVDNTAPQLTVSGPNGEVFGAGSTQQWMITASDATSGVAAVECSLVAQGEAFSFGPCSSGATGHAVSDLPGGDYRFDVRVRDNAGWIVQAERIFTIDATPPDTSLTSAPGTWVRSGDVTFGFESSEPGSTFECRVYSSGLTPPDFAPCSDAASHTASGLAQGTYAFEVRAADAVGNIDQSPASVSFTVDTVAPRTTIKSGPAKVVKTRHRKVRATFRLQADEAEATYRCKLDSKKWTACSAKPTFKVGKGKHVLRVAATDPAGNRDATPATWRWTVKRKR